MNKDEVVNPPGVQEVLDVHLKKQVRLASERRKLLEQLKDLKVFKVHLKAVT